MFQIAKKIISIVLVAFLMVGTLPKRADAVIPGIAAAAAALGCSEGTLVAVGGALLTAGGIVAAGESEKVKVVSAAVAGLGSAALERLSAAVNAVGPGGQYTLPIDSLLASTIGEMVQNVEDVASSGEGIEIHEIGEEVVFSIPFSQISLGGVEGIITCVADWQMDPDAGHKFRLYIKGTNYVNDNWTGLYVWTSSSNKSSTESGQHEISLYYQVYENGAKVVDTTLIQRVLCGSDVPYHWNVPLTNIGEHSFGAAVYDGQASLFVDGESVYQNTAITSDYGLQAIEGQGTTSYTVPFLYSIDSIGEEVLTPGVDYTNAGLTPEQIASLAGTTITGDVVTNVYNPPAINPPVTWPEATDLTGVIGALQNVWNSVTQGFARVYTYLQAIVDSISTTLDPNILQEPINNLKTFIVGKVPELPDLDTSGFSEREWSWMVTINHPINISFEVLNSQTLESARPTIKGFTSGVLILITTIYMYRRIPEIVKG